MPGLDPGYADRTLGDTHSRSLETRHRNARVDRSHVREPRQKPDHVHAIHSAGMESNDILLGAAAELRNRREIRARTRRRMSPAISTGVGSCSTTPLSSAASRRSSLSRLFRSVLQGIEMNGHCVIGRHDVAKICAPYATRATWQWRCIERSWPDRSFPQTRSTGTNRPIAAVMISCPASATVNACRVFW